jgi:hypothetical protein
MKTINKKTLGITQTLILVVAIFAFAFMISSGIETVSADVGGWCDERGLDCDGEGEKCIIVNNEGNGQCECKEGYEPRGTRCVKKVQEETNEEFTCETDDECKIRFGLGHVCLSGRCVKEPKYVLPIEDMPGMISADDLQKDLEKAGVPQSEAEKAIGEEKSFSPKGALGIVGGLLATYAKGKVNRRLTKIGDGILKDAGEALKGSKLKDFISPPSMSGEEIDYLVEITQFKNGEIDKISEGAKKYQKSLEGIPPTAGWYAAKGIKIWWKIAYNYAIAIAAAFAYYRIAKAMGASDRNLRQLAVAGAGSAIVVGTAATLGTVGVTTLGLSAAMTWAGGLIAGSAATGVGLLVAAAVLVAMAAYAAFTFQNYAQDVFNYKVGVWQPQDGGENCLECNDLRYGCSEYQCHSFGKSCEIVNPGTEVEQCTWVNKNDIEYPIMTPLVEALPSEEYQYMEIDAQYPEDRGVEIQYNGECIDAYTSLSFGIETNEPAECKINLERNGTFEDMLSYFSEGPVSIYNHTLTIPSAGIPSSDALASLGIEIENGASQRFFVKCKDTNGNENPTNFMFEFCVKDGPDTSAPRILGTNYQNPSYISFNQSTIPLEVYTNEPATCKWDFEDYDYAQMNNEFPDCSQSIVDYLDPSSYTYGCKGELTGLQSMEDNIYYIKCMDKPLWNDSWLGKRMDNKESFVLTLKGSYPLEINNITVNGKGNNTIIKDSTNTIKSTIKVKTSAGANEGKSRCQYSANNLTFYDFFNEGSFDYALENVQDLWLADGDYNYYLKCQDEGGNIARGEISFSIDQDLEPPKIIRTYKEESYLKLITEEEAECVYTTSDCDYVYEDGLETKETNGFNHFLSWNIDQSFYIKCKDIFGNQPELQSTCTAIVKPY